jgi:hypothetical protein
VLATPQLERASSILFSTPRAIATDTPRRGAEKTIAQRAVEPVGVQWRDRTVRSDAGELRTLTFLFILHIYGCRALLTISPLLPEALLLSCLSYLSVPLLVLGTSVISPLTEVYIHQLCFNFQQTDKCIPSFVIRHYRSCTPEYGSCFTPDYNIFGYPARRRRINRSGAQWWGSRKRGEGQWIHCRVASADVLIQNACVR